MGDAKAPPGRPLEDKVILVVGGSTGIGGAGAWALASAGADVTVTSHDLESLATLRASMSGAVDTIHADARSPEATERAVESVVATRGRLDGLYHVAGGSGRQFGDGPLHQITDDGWRATFELNMGSVLHSNRAAIRQFLRQRSGGVILNVGSVLAFHPSPRFFATHAYAAAKAAIEGLTRSIASYYAAHNIRANVIAPGLTETPMAQRALADNTVMDFVRTKQPLDGGRAARAGDLDAAAVFLLSDGAAFVTGQSICVDGGWSCSDGQYESFERAS